MSTVVLDEANHLTQVSSSPWLGLLMEVDRRFDAMAPHVTPCYSRCSASLVCPSCWYDPHVYLQIGSNWAITAAHCVANSILSFSLWIGVDNKCFLSRQNAR